MRAVVQDRYGSPDLLRLDEIEPPAPGEDEVLVRVRAASVHPDVWHVVRGLPYVLRIMGSGLRRPKARVPGTDVAGVVEAVGAGVTRFAPGDEVFGECVRGHQWKNGGAYAELVAVREAALEPKPPNVSFEQAACVPTSGFFALNSLRDEGRLRAGQQVLINGAAGGVGALSLQIARSMGARVTGVDAPDRLELMRSLGADRVIDYTEEDFTRGTDRYDLIFDIPGNHPFPECRRALTPDGTYILLGHDGFGSSAGRWLGSVPRVLKLVAMSMFVRQLPKPSFKVSSTDHLAVLAGMIETGDLTPVVGATYPLDEVPAAIRAMERGVVPGRIVITA